MAQNHITYRKYPTMCAVWNITLCKWTSFYICQDWSGWNTVKMKSMEICVPLPSPVSLSILLPDENKNVYKILNKRSCHLLCVGNCNANLIGCSRQCPKYLMTLRNFLCISCQTFQMESELRLKPNALTWSYFFFFEQKTGTNLWKKHVSKHVQILFLTD